MVTKGHPRIYLLAAVLAAACCGAAGAQAATPICTLSASKVSKQIQLRSAKQTNERLHANSGIEITRLAACVSTGAKAWLDIANEVLKKTPEDGDDELSMALASALDVNAEGVLAEPWPFNLNLICHVSDDVDTYGASIKSLDFRIRKVEAVKDSALQSKVQECVDSLNANKNWMAHYYQADDDVPPAPNPGTAPPPPDPGTAPPIPDPPPAPDPGTAPPPPDPGTAPPIPDPPPAPDPGTAPPPPLKKRVASLFSLSILLN